MDYSKMSDAEINGLVMDALSDGNQAYRRGNDSVIELLHQVNTVEFGEHVEREEVYATFDPCNNPADAWPIILENRIGIEPGSEGVKWAAQVGNFSNFWADKNPLRAAMILFLDIQGSADVQDNPA